jgi:Arc/MetJ-type ribon-helix-helix transcriptional regulator
MRDNRSTLRVDKPEGMIYGHTIGPNMPKAKIAITISEEALLRVDALVKDGTFANRSLAIETAVEEKLSRLDRVVLARECLKLDPAFEKELAEEGFAEDAAKWPGY